MKLKPILLTLCLAPILACAQTPPTGLQFSPSSNLGLDGVLTPPPHGLKRWQASGCMSTAWGQFNLGKGFSLQSDVLGGIAFTNSALVGGYDVDLAYQFAISTVSNKLTVIVKFGGAQLFGAGVNPAIGVNGSVSLNIALK